MMLKMSAQLPAVVVTPHAPRPRACGRGFV
jgi:hypothetical protein